MKKLIQICSLLSLVVVFSIVSANAQSTVERYQANIPFAFNVGEKNFEAGTYVMNLAKAPAGKILSIEDTKRHKLETIFVMERGDAKPKSSKLSFTRDSDNQWVLAKIFTTEKGFTVARSKAKNQVAKNKEAADSNRSTASVDLK